MKTKSKVSIAVAALALSLMPSIQCQEEVSILLPESGANVAYGEWFLDVDPGFGAANPIKFSEGREVHAGFEFDTAGISPGAHSLFVRFQDDLGNWTTSQTSPFVVMLVIQPAAISWRVLENDKVIMEDRQEITQTGIESVETIATEPIVSESLESDFRFEMQLLWAENASLGWISHEFELIEPAPDVDSDGDGLWDRVETGTGQFVSMDDTGTDPSNPDSDGDGLTDGEESGSPLNPNIDDSEIIQYFSDRTRFLGFPAPVIERGTDGKLTIRLSLDASEDLNQWFKLALEDNTFQADNGDIVIQLPVRESNTLFFQLKAHE